MTYDTINDAQTIEGNGEGTLLAGRYRIVRQLGSGGMGSVWLAEDTQLDNKPFAIKMLPSILVSNKRAYRQLKDEALVAMKLTHPNIVTLRAFEENNGNPFLVMDYVDGQTLDDYLAEKGKLSEDEVIRVLRPIAAALDYAHGEGVVHRDVKPANVMIRKDGHPFILDFGIAREIQETMTRVTGKLSSGTLLYMSPEQLMGEKPAPAQDIYSFAAMAYECLKGEPPFSHGQIEFQIMNKLPEPLTGDTGLRAPFAVGVMVGLAKKPAGRPVTCAAVLRVDNSSRVEHVERVDGRARSPSGPQSGIPRPMVVRDPPIVSPSVGARVPQDRPAERSSSATEGIVVPVNTPHQDGALKALAVAAGIAFVVVGVWWYVNQKHEDSRMAEQQAEEVRKAEDADRMKREAEIRKAEAERKAAEERVRLAAEAAARVAATEIRIEANVQKANVERISDADGFKEKKDALAESFARADALLDENTKSWSEAAVLFTNYVNGCKALVVLDGERQVAVAKRTEAQAAFRRAEDAGAKTLAKTRWNEAVGLWQNADTRFKGMEFTAAGDGFVSAARQFAQSEEDAAAERRRQEEAAAAKAKAEQAAREREAAEARERAEKEARERERRKNWRKEGEQFTINDPYGLDLTMKWCPAGTFEMGSPQTEKTRHYWSVNNGEKKIDMEFQHQVTLSKGFWIGETEVTQGQWKLLMSGETIADLVRKGLNEDALYYSDGKKKPLRDIWDMSRYDDPMKRCGELNDNVSVYNMNWHEADEFCRRLTQCEHGAGRIPDGYRYRLPTEAEWEYACRAGTTATLPNGHDLYVVGENNAPALDDIAWYGGNSSVGFGSGRGVDTSDWKEKQYPGGRAFVRAVKGKRANAWGIYDMLGNVREWCGDWAGDYKRGSVEDPIGYAKGSCRIIRGGGWNNVPSFCRPASRGFKPPGYRNYNIGFRVALAPVLPKEGREMVQNKPQVDVNVYADKNKQLHNKVQLWEGGPYWADRNIGAEKPEDYGYYFWWGDTVGYKRVNNAWVSSDGSSSGFSFKPDKVPTYEKDIPSLQRMGWITEDNVLTPEHDAAHVQWGDGWRMPTDEELYDLDRKCDWIWTTMNGVNGYLVRGRGNYASSSIFLPCAGYGRGTSLYLAGSHGYYWSSVPYSYNIYYSWGLYFYSSSHNARNGSYRYDGFSVRPVQGFTK